MPSKLAGPLGTPNQPEYTAQAAMCTLGLIIYPPADTTITAFITGLEIFARTLNLPSTVLHRWLQLYNRQIFKSARTHMEIFPPADRSQSLSLGLTEFYSEAWRTLYIRANGEANPLALGWKPADEELPGTWIIFETPASGTVVSAGFSSSRVSLIKKVEAQHSNEAVERKRMGLRERRNSDSFAVENKLLRFM